MEEEEGREEGMSAWPRKSGHSLGRQAVNLRSQCSRGESRGNSSAAPKNSIGTSEGSVGLSGEIENRAENDK